MFGIERRFASSDSIIKWLKSNNSSSISKVQNLPIPGDKEEILLHLCLELIEANESSVTHNSLLNTLAQHLNTFHYQIWVLKALFRSRICSFFAVA
jgi:hypothetical protein